MFDNTVLLQKQVTSRLQFNVHETEQKTTEWHKSWHD